MWLFRSRGVVGLIGLLAIGVLVGSLTIGLPAASQQGSLVPEELIVGMNPAKAVSVLQPAVEGMAKLLLEYVQTHGFPEVKRVKAFVPENYTATVEAIGTSKIHVALLAPLLIVQTVDRYGTIPTNVVKRGETLRYRSQFMVFLDSPYGNMLDLVDAVKAGKSVRFGYGGSSTSVSGFLFACKTLKDYGILPGDSPNLKTLRLANHQASALAVYKKDIDVGVAFDGAHTEILDSEAVKKELGWKQGDPLPSSRIALIGFSDWIPNDGIVVIKDIKPELRGVIQAGFAELIKTDPGKGFAYTALSATDFLPTPQQYDMIAALKPVRVVANDISANLAKCENQ